MRRNLTIALSLAGLAACAAIAAGAPAPAAAQESAPVPAKARLTLLQSVIESLQQGKPDFSQMEPALQDSVREQLPAMSVAFKQLGALKSVSVLDGEQGSEIYQADFESGSALWTMSLSGNGKIEGLNFRPM